MQIVIVNSGRPFVDVDRYAMYSHPWQDQREGRTEISCLECRSADHMPIVIWSGHKSSLTSVLTAIANHNHDAHVA